MTRKRKEAKRKAHRKADKRKAKLDEDKRLIEKQEVMKKPTLWDELLALEPADGAFASRVVKLTLKSIAEMSDDEVYRLSMTVPDHAKQLDLMVSPEQIEDAEDMAQCMNVLMIRLMKIKKKK